MIAALVAATLAAAGPPVEAETQPERSLVIAELVEEVAFGRCGSDGDSEPEVRIYRVVRVCRGAVEVDGRERFTVYRECPRGHRDVPRGTRDFLDLAPGRCASGQVRHRLETGGAYCARFDMPYSSDSPMISIECGAEPPGSAEVPEPGDDGSDPLAVGPEVAP